MQGGYTAAQLHPDGLILGAGTADGSVRIWEVRQQKVGTLVMLSWLHLPLSIITHIRRCCPMRCKCPSRRTIGPVLKEKIWIGFQGD